jgi:hypothetical protein
MQFHRPSLEPEALSHLRDLPAPDRVDLQQDPSVQLAAHPLPMQHHHTTTTTTTTSTAHLLPVLHHHRPVGARRGARLGETLSLFVCRGARRGLSCAGGDRRGGVSRGQGQVEGPRWRGGAPPQLGTLWGSPANIGGGGSETEERGQVEQRTDRPEATMDAAQRNRSRKSEKGFIVVWWVGTGGSGQAAPSTHHGGGKLVR